MKGSDIEVGKRYSAKVDYTDHVIVDVLETGVERKRGYSGKTQANGVRVRIVFPYSRYGRTEPAGAEKVIATRDVAFKWTADHQQRREARNAEETRLAARVARLRDTLIERGIDGKVDRQGVRLSLDVAEELLEIESAVSA